MPDYLHPDEWLHFAEKLERGQKASHRHTCGDGPKLLVENADNGYKAWCYRCGSSGFVPHAKPSLAERIAALNTIRRADSVTENDPRPPMPANFDPSSWPLVARAWLYKAGLSNDVIQSRGIYWCDRISRVVIPVLVKGHVVYWQARGFDKDRPKYLNPKVDKPLYKMPGPDENLLCLTEDILSAVRVGPVCEAWSLLGTSLSLPVATEIAQTGRPVAIWLDPDEAGVKGRGKVYRALRSLGVDARIIRADRDPKEYNKQEIKEYLLSH